MVGELRFVDSRPYHISLSTQTLHGLIAWSVRNKTNLGQNRVTFSTTFTLPKPFERRSVMYWGQLCDMRNNASLYFALLRFAYVRKVIHVMQRGEVTCILSHVYSRFFYSCSLKKLGKWKRKSVGHYGHVLRHPYTLR